ncbi:hypothetical protein [Chitinophaga caseinilytica]|uniref:Carboxypeptidase regulatory-like domain-containing protein n=1 Tax=Chitinophaga caseinilytica TaxID=2267521 RepID=A0ABZ2YYT5_9BACT
MKIIIPILASFVFLGGAGCKKAADLKATGHVEGQVIDQNTGNPIPGAKLYVSGCKSGFLGGSGSCNQLATAITDAEGKYRITWNGDGYSNTFYLRAAYTDSAQIAETGYGTLLNLETNNIVNKFGYKGRKVNVRVTVNKNEGRLLRLRYGSTFPTRALLRPGAADTTFTVWTVPGQSTPLWIAALDQQQENYHGVSVLIRVAPWTEAVRDTAFVIDDILAQPKLPQFQP